ncbi:MAG: hypothetical protein JWN35_2877 [Frankiales bacterium]|jgi:N-acetylmuramoyl-L-alanine amidase|nr:hypothetical protein [Frankiales bacterium]
MPRSAPRILLGSTALAAGLSVALVLPLAPGALADPTPSPDPSATAEPSPSASPVPAATTLTLSRSNGTVVYGGVLTLTGRLTYTDGSPVAGALVDVWSRTQGQAARLRVTRVRTGADGRAYARITPRTSAEYQLRYAGDAASAGALSPLLAANVQPRLTGAFSPAGLQLGQTSVLSGTLSPAYAGARVTVRRKLDDGTYQDVAVLATNGAGAYRWAVTPGLARGYVFRAVLPAKPAWLLTYTGPMGLQVDLRDLRQGQSGGDVLSLERRLAAQHADVGRIDGVFDSELTHAVLAFQKSQGLPRTATYDAATRVRLAAPAAVRLRAPTAGRAVEIDLTKQVLYVSEAGKLTRVLDISSGSNQLYESQGVTSRAYTPLGSFSIQRKINKMHESPLGLLYRPAFFYQGWAIHGSGSVPVYPASHGCIRVTNPVMDRLYDLLTIGTPVTLYSS